MGPQEFREKLDLVHAILGERWKPKKRDGLTWTFDHIAHDVPLSCYAEINPQMSVFLFRAVAPPAAPEVRGPLAEFLTRINHPIPIGSWAIDLADGDVRWKTGLYLGGNELTEDLIRQIVETSLFFIDKHLAGIAKLQSGGTMEEALATIG